MGKKDKRLHDPSSVPTGEKVEESVAVHVPPPPVVTPEIPVGPWVSGIYYTLKEIAMTLNELEQLGFIISNFDFERKLGGEIEVLYRITKPTGV